MNKKQIKELEELQKLKDSGTLSEEEFQTEKGKILKPDDNKSSVKQKAGSKKLTISLIIIVLLIICVIVVFLVLKNNQKSNEDIEDNEMKIEATTSNIDKGNLSDTSFDRMSSDDKNLTEVQGDLVNYFDNNYFPFFSKQAQAYPQVFKGAKIYTSAAVVKVLKSTDDEFQILAVDCGLDTPGYNYYSDISLENYGEESKKQLLVISGKQLSQRLVVNDTFFIFGRYQDVDNVTIDGKTYMVSKIQANNLERFSYNDSYINKFSFDTVKKVSEYIFGNDIKVSDPGGDKAYFKVVLDNQSNVNFKSFDMYKTGGFIKYDIAENNLDSNIEKNLFVSTDFQHYIVSTHDKNTRHLYVEYYDKNYNKIWKREFDYNSSKTFSSPMDFNNKKLSFVIDNELYILNIDDGTNIIEPVIVGEKTNVLMLDDGILLVGDNSKDTIMKVDFDGKILFKTNVATQDDIVSPDGYFINSYVQILNDKIAICLETDGVDRRIC